MSTQRVNEGENSTNSTQNRPRGRPAWADRFIADLRRHGSVSRAALAAGVDRTTPYTLRKDDEHFALEWDVAFESLTDDLEETLLDRAIKGWDEPVFHDGEECGVKRKYDNVLGEKLLRARRRKQYNPKTGDSGSSGDEALDRATQIREYLKLMRATVPTEPPAKPKQPSPHPPAKPDKAAEGEGAAG